jgi:nucleoside-diphosphate-sugar epimerase
VIVLVTGASGLLGRAVATELVTAGHSVRTLQRRPSGVAGATDILGSVTDRDLVTRAVDGAEGVVHLAAKVSLAGAREEFRAVNVDGTRSLLDASERAGIARFVQVSSPSVAHAGSSLVGVGAEPADPERAHGDYARTKAEAEGLALARDSASMHVVAVRPHLVWGPGDTQLVARIVERARRGRLPLLDGGTALIDTIYIDNAATGIAAALERSPVAHGNAYVLTNGEPRPVGELLAGICLAAGVEPPRRSIPAWLGRAAGSVIERVWAIAPGEDEPPMTRFLAEQLSTAHWFDQRDTRRDLDWAPTVSIDEGLRRLAASYAG